MVVGEKKQKEKKKEEESELYGLKKKLYGIWYWKYWVIHKSIVVIQVWLCVQDWSHLALAVQNVSVQAHNGRYTFLCN